MILDIRDRWLICTPGKTGTTSLASALVKRERGVAVRVMPQHRPYEDTDRAVPHRMMTVRHPIDRWCSCYFYLTRGEGCGAKFAQQGLVPFAEEFFRQEELCRSIEPGHGDWSVWTWDFTKYAQVLMLPKYDVPPECWDVTLDDGESLLKMLADRYGYYFDKAKIPHMRNSKREVSWQDTVAQLPAHLQDKVYNWAARDVAWLKPNNGAPYSF